MNIGPLLSSRTGGFHCRLDNRPILLREVCVGEGGGGGPGETAQVPKVHRS